MKRTFLVIVTVLMAMVLAVSAYGVKAGYDLRKAYNWYCKKSVNGQQPTLPEEFSFIEAHGGYYIDKNVENREDKVIYLTFDCGYENGNVEKILGILKAHNAKGAFFVLGNIIKRNTALVKRMCNDGHLVCNHTVSHKNMTKIASIEDFREELDALNEIMKEYCGCELAPFYRPPEGCFSEQNLIWASEIGYKTIFWSCAYDDWDNNRQMSSEKAMEKLTSRLHNGEVLLLHPTSATNASILDELLTYLEREGYRFGTLYELVEDN